MKYVFHNVEIINKETGEILDTSNLSENVYELNEDDIKEIVERFLMVKEIYNKVGSDYRVIEKKFIDIMESNEATKYEDENCIIKLTKQYDYKYDTKMIDELKEIIDDDKFNKTFEKQYKVNRTFLKSLMTMGGNIKKIIDTMQTKICRKPSIKIKIK